MKRVVIVTWTVATVFAIVLFDLRGRAQGNALVYADFETVADNRPVSARGGLGQLVAFQEEVLHKATFKGLENADPPAPELVRIPKDDPNKAMKFDFAIQAPNVWAGVGVEIHGLPDKDGKPVSDDVSGYKTLSLQVYATGAAILRLEAISHGQGVDLTDIFKKLTSLNLQVFCDECRPMQGMVVVDNVVFEK